MPGFRCHAKRPTDTQVLGFSPDGHLLATSDDRDVVLWDLTEPTRPTLAHRLPTLRHVHAAAFTPDGRHLVTDGGTGIVVWNLTAPGGPARRAAEDGPAVERAGHDDVVLSMAFRPDGTVLAAAHYSWYATQYDHVDLSTVVLWDFTDPAHPAQAARLMARPAFRHRARKTTRPGPATFSGHARTVRTLAVSSGGQLATGGDDQTVLLWDITDPTRPRPIATVSTRGAVQTVAFSPDGRLLATTTRGRNAGSTLWTTNREPHSKQGSGVIAIDPFR